MRTLWLFGVLAFMALGTVADALSIPDEIRPGDRDSPFVFVISSERMVDGNVQFTVTVTAKFSLAEYGTSLSTTRITDHDGSDRGRLSLPSKKEGGSIQCVFLVTPQELEDSDLAFRLTKPYPNHGWGYSCYYAPLHKYLPH